MSDWKKRVPRTPISSSVSRSSAFQSTSSSDSICRHPRPGQQACQ